MVENLLETIKRAINADANELKLLRKNLIDFVDGIGPKQFVTVTAELLKTELRIEGCNDARVPLKRIFSIPLDELEEVISNRDYGLPAGHPISALSKDHRDNIRKLRQLDLDFQKAEGKASSREAIDAIKGVSEYYAELDLHIRKEEEVFFPALERNGMSEHPDSLKEDHKGFRGILEEIIEAGEEIGRGDHEASIEKIAKFRGKFVLDLSNHVFRETCILYPAALEFIQDASDWEEIRKGFEQNEKT